MVARWPSEKPEKPRARTFESRFYYIVFHQILVKAFRLEEHVHKELQKRRFSIKIMLTHWILPKGISF